MSHFKEFETKSDITFQNAFIKILSEPKKTLTYVLKNHPTKYIYHFFLAACIINSFNNFGSYLLLGNLNEFFMTLLLALGVGWLVYIIYAYTLNFFGLLLKGKSLFKYYKTILAWGQIPRIFSIIIVIFQVTFQKTYLTQTSLLNSEYIFLFTGLIIFFSLIVETWSIIIIIKGIMLIQNFSLGEALLNYFLPLIILAIFFTFYVYLQ